jgi:hypothetical protein
LLAPNNRAYIENRRLQNAIAGDVFGFFYEIAPDADRFVDRLAARATDDRPESSTFAGFRRKWRRFHEDGHLCEARYLEWRRQRRLDQEVDLISAAMWGKEEMGEQLGTLIETNSVRLVDAGFKNFDAPALQYLQQRFGFEQTKNVLKRGAVRICGDLDGYDSALMRQSVELSNDRYESEEFKLSRELEDVYDYLPGNRSVVQSGGNPKHALRYIRRGKERQRRAVARAIRFAQRLLNTEQVRLFVGGNKLRITGQHAIYELRKTGPMSGSHGSAELKVFTKEGDIELCNLCIYTPGVPLMDHVGSIVMHIRAGAEEDILRIGNAFNVKPQAYEQPWLVQHLPPQAPVVSNPDYRNMVLAGRLWAPKFPKETPSVRFPGSEAIVQLPEPERMDLILAMNNQILDRVLDEFGRYLPKMPTTISLIRTGKFPEEPEPHFLGGPLAVAA